MDYTPSRRIRAAKQQTSPRPRYEKLTPLKRRKRLLPIHIMAFVTIMIITVVGIYAFSNMPHRLATTPTPSSNSKDDGQVTQASPDFAALTPSNKEVVWARLAPPNSGSFYAYSDKLEGVAIRVSEQPLPDNFTRDPSDELSQLARNYNANRTIAVDTATIYIGTSQKGQQSLLFIKNALLVMITADSTLNDKQWTDYIASLH